METVLLHTCCAPCSLSCIDPLRGEGIEPVAFWYNPNIHPWKEYQARRDCLLQYAPTIGLEVRVREDYGLREFVRHTAALLASLYQDHEGIARAAERLAGQYGVRFLYRDFRPNFREGNRRARELGFYMQKYCGCVFSEQERYQKQIDRDKAAFAGS